MTQDFWNEEWIDLSIEGFEPKNRYMISNYGRIKSFASDPEGRILKTHQVDGYPALSFRMANKKTTLKYLHKLVAMHYLAAPKSDQQYVIHKDYVKTNNFVENLAWANKEELEEHLIDNPNRRIVYGHRNYSKLSETDVIRLKKRIFDPNRKTRLKLLAKEFGISEMQLYRIKRGENWATVGIPVREGKPVLADQ
jgi:hypothetical protein